jgi:hypothetical protein
MTAAAFLDSGGRNAWTPLETASTPVRGEHQPEHHDEEVGRDREDGAGLAHPAQVHERHDKDREQPHADPMRDKLRKRRRQRINARRHRHRYSEGVVDQQGSRGDQASARAQVLPGHEVGATPLRIRDHCLAVAHHDHDEQQDDEYRDVERVADTDRAGSHQH